MSYTNGIGSGQQGFAGVAPVAEKPVATTNEVVNTVSQASGLEEDQTNISASGGLLSQVIRGTEVSSDRIAALQQSIAAGTYSVPASAVADKLIQSLLS
jgi:flagellar biosynthesis anti-sigma factor FlgM